MFVWMTRNTYFIVNGCKMKLENKDKKGIKRLFDQKIKNLEYSSFHYYFVFFFSLFYFQHAIHICEKSENYIEENIKNEEKRKPQNNIMCIDFTSLWDEPSTNRAMNSHYTGFLRCDFFSLTLNEFIYGNSKRHRE